MKLSEKMDFIIDQGQQLINESKLEMNIVLPIKYKEFSKKLLKITNLKILDMDFDEISKILNIKIETDYNVGKIKG